MWNKNELTKMLNIKYPIIQGPFGGGFSTAILTSSVSNAGGLGSFGAHNLSPQNIKKKIHEIKSLTDKAFAINLWVSDSDKEIINLSPESYTKASAQYLEYHNELGISIPEYSDSFGENFEDQAQAMIEASPPVFSFVFGIPSQKILDQCRSKGIITIGAATTLEEALKIEEAGVDILVATGFEAGGHRPSFLNSAEESLMGTLPLLSQVSEKIKIPIIVAGGLANAKGIAATHILGAQGFQLGTAFLACLESGASQIHRDIILSERSHKTTLSRAYTGRLARFIENDFLKVALKNNFQWLPYPAQNHLLKSLKTASLKKNRADITPMYAGQGAPLLKYNNVKDLMNSLITEIPKYLS